MWLKLSGRSFTYIKKSSGPNIAAWGTPANIGTHFECWLVRTNLYCLLLRILSNSLSNVPGKPRLSSSYKRPSCHALSCLWDIQKIFSSSDELAKCHLEKFTNVIASDVVKFLWHETLGFWKLWLGTAFRRMAIAERLFWCFTELS